MTYQIVYFSPEGHIRTIAQALVTLFPEGTPCEALDDQEPDAQVQLVGFEHLLKEGRNLPECVTAYLSKLSGRTIFLFSAVSFQLQNFHSTKLHRLVEEALPRECDYVGMYLCPMEPGENTLAAFRTHSEKNPENTRAKHWLDCHEQAQGHPNEEDLNQIKSFARHVLRLNN